MIADGDGSTKASIELESILIEIRDRGREWTTPSMLRALGHGETRVDRAIRYGVSIGALERQKRGYYRMTADGAQRFSAGFFASAGDAESDRRAEWRANYRLWVELQRAIGINHDLELPGATADPSRLRRHDGRR